MVIGKYWKQCAKSFKYYLSFYLHGKEVRGHADKSLARPVRKQATANKLGIYSTYSPLISIQFLAPCTDFCKPPQKMFRKVSVQPGLRGSNDLRFGRKMATFQLFFQSRERVVVRRGQIRRIGWMIKTLEAQVGQFLPGCKCPVGRGIVVQEQDLFDELPAPFFLQKALQLHQQRWVILRVDSSALWKIMNEEDAFLIPKNRGENFSSRFLHSEFFWGGVSRYAATPLIVALSSGHSDITRFRSSSPIATGNQLDRAEKTTKVTQTSGTVDVFDPRSGILGPTSRRASACPHLHEWWTRPAHVRCPVAQLLM